MEELVKYLKALVALQVNAMNGPDAITKPELVLSRAGLTAREISEILGKTTAAVAKAIERSKKAARTIPAEPISTLSEEQLPS